MVCVGGWLAQVCVAPRRSGFSVPIPYTCPAHHLSSGHTLNPEGPLGLQWLLASPFEYGYPGYTVLFPYNARCWCLVVGLNY